jgi:hypothetical protein
MRPGRSPQRTVLPQSSHSRPPFFVISLLFLWPIAFQFLLACTTSNKSCTSSATTALRPAIPPKYPRADARVLGGCRKTPICGVILILRLRGVNGAQGARHRETAEESSRLTLFALCLKPVTYASFLRVLDPLHLSIFQQPPKPGFSDKLLDPV